ncbi:MAG: hypothetical protein EBQ53_00470 [Betaproteobacteria bacterium]|nr:hypothetical protein [Betaproteobacteria bacterium]
MHVPAGRFQRDHAHRPPQRVWSEHRPPRDLSGRQREIVRVGQDVTWYMPESKTVRTERQSYRRFFPDLFGPERARTVSQFYEISRAGTDRWQATTASTTCSRRKTTFGIASRSAPRPRRGCPYAWPP